MEGRRRKRCGSCEFVLFRNPASAAAALVLDVERRVLLVRRAIRPFQGDWALPAGYQEVDEDPASTAVREVREEAGLEVEPVRLLDLLFVPESQDARKAANVALFHCRILSGALRPGHDAADAAFFDLDRLPPNLGFDNGPLILDRVRRGGDLHGLVQP